MQSMTGYGRGQNERNGTKVTVEIKSVNGKFLDTNIKAPRFYAPLEDFIKKSISTTLTRGNVDVFIIHEEKSKSTEVEIDLKVAEKFREAAKKISKELKIKDDLKISKLLSFPDVVSIRKQEINEEELTELLSPALQTAISAIHTMRKTEGKNLARDIKSIASDIKKDLDKIEKQVPKMLESIHTKQKQRVKELLGEIEIDEGKLANEMAFWADKLDIHEEIERLKSHLLQLDKMTKEEGVGKKLEFLAQELTREINTTGSKSNDIEITKLVLSMKSHVERLKEQIRNIE